MALAKVDTPWFVPKPRNVLGESPLFRESDSTLHWVDCFSDPPTLHILPVSHDGEPIGDSRVVPLPDLISVIYFRKNHPGSYICATSNGIAYLDEFTGQIEPLVDTIRQEHDGKVRINDGYVDAKGRFWVGEADFDALAIGVGKVPADYRARGNLMRYDPDGTIHILEENFLLCGNGIAMSPDYKKLYVTESITRTIYIYDLDFESGNVTGKRIFLRFSDSREPDGMVTDSEGNLWVALCCVGKIGVFNSSGILVHEIKLPVQNVTCPTWGGKTFDTLFITTAMPEPVLEDFEDLGGNLFAYRVGVESKGGASKYEFGL